MLIIPIADTFSQTFKIQLANQNCQIALYQKSTGLYCDVSVNDAPIVVGAICQNMNRIMRAGYTGFVGDLFFQDTQGGLDPSSPGLGTRFVLGYLEASDLT